MMHEAKPKRHFDWFSGSFQHFNASTWWTWSQSYAELAQLLNRPLQGKVQWRSHLYWSGKMPAAQCLYSFSCSVLFIFSLPIFVVQTQRWWHLCWPWDHFQKYERLGPSRKSCVKQLAHLCCKNKWNLSCIPDVADVALLDREKWRMISSLAGFGVPVISSLHGCCEKEK